VGPDAALRAVNTVCAFIDPLRIVNQDSLVLVVVGPADDGSQRLLEVQAE
jgi:hypothetical protein